MDKKLIAMCGLDCSKCDAYIAYQTGDDELRERAAKEWTVKYGKPGNPPLKPEEINCAGCTSEGPYYEHCNFCNIRKCGLEKKFATCLECKDYSCEELAKFHEHAQDAKQNLDKIKAEKD